MTDRSHYRGRPLEVQLEPLDDRENVKKRQLDDMDASSALLDRLRKHHPERDTCQTG
jgi:hypothetical protein